MCTRINCIKLENNIDIFVKRVYGDYGYRKVTDSVFNTIPFFSLNFVKSESHSNLIFKFYFSIKLKLWNELSPNKSQAINIQK